MTDIGFSCSCGALRGVLHEVAPGNGCHLVCYCKDCRAFARHLGHLEALDAGGGSPLVQVLPSRVEITSGVENVACARLSAKGLHRWYASCCNTPLANTVSTPRVPLVGLWRPNFDTLEAIGPVVTQVFTRMALPGGPVKDKGIARLLGGLLKRTLAEYATGRVHKNPFFNKDRALIVTPAILNEAERAAAYAE
ncbi:MAG: DUF6151 family protein [Roseobacter sp.]